MGAEIRVHDPYVPHWWEFEQQDTYPGEGHSKSRFFRNQEKLTNLNKSRFEECIKRCSVCYICCQA